MGGILLAAVVVNVMVEGPLPVTDEPAHVNSDGRSKQVKVTTPVKPPSAATVTPTVPWAPGLATGTVAEFADKVKSTECVPAPVFQTVGALTRLAAFTDPRPVARSYPAPALNPESTPIRSPGVLTTQFSVPAEHGMAIVPTVISLKTHPVAGGPAEL